MTAPQETVFNGLSLSSSLETQTDLSWTDFGYEQTSPHRAQLSARVYCLLLVSLLILLVGIYRARLQKSSGKPRAFRISHVYFNILLLSGAVSCCCCSSWLYLHAPAQGIPKDVERLVGAISWALAAFGRVAYFFSRTKRHEAYRTSNHFSLALFLLSTVPHDILPLVTLEGREIFSLPRIQLAYIILSLVTSILLPLLTPCHDEVRSRPTHPRDRTSPITRWWFYSWLDPLMGTAYRAKGSLALVDLYPITEDSEPTCWNKKFLGARAKTGSTRAALWHLFKTQLFFMSMCMVFCGVSEFLGAYGLRDLLKYLQGSKDARHRPWFSILLFGISPIVRGLWMQTFEFFSTHNIGHLKAIVISTVYQRLLHQPPGSKPNLGLVNNHISADVDKIATLRYTIMAIFLVPVEVMVASVLLYQTMGWSYIPGLLFILLTRVPISLVISKAQGVAQSKVMAGIDSRVHRMGETVRGLSTIKMLGQTTSFMAWVLEKRTAELGAIWKKFLVVTAGDAISSIFVLLPLVISLSIYCFGARMPLESSVVFTVVAVFSTLKSMLSLAVLGTGTYAQALVSLGRVVDFLDKSFESTERDESSYRDGPVPEEFGMRSVTLGVKDDDNRVRVLLRDVTIKFVRGGLNLITGKTGSGKSVLLRGLINETPILSGVVSIQNNPDEAISYAGQTLWTQRGSIRENILFNLPFHQKRYDEVLRATGLKLDLDTIAGGDNADIGEGGISVSGGQRQRIALGRALYADTEVVILDDVLSALDTSTADWVVNNCIFGPIMEGRTLILASNYQKCIDNADLLVSLEEGTVKSMETRAGRSALARQTIVAQSEPATHSKHPTLVTVATTADEESDSSRKPPESEQNNPKESTEAVELLQGKQNSRFQVFLYLRQFGSWPYLILLLLAMLSAQAADVGAMYWLTRWSRKHDPPNNRDVKDGLYFGVYTAISALQIILSGSSQLLLFGGSLHASKSSHLRLLSTVLHATYEWIVKTPSGQIMNRFSSDMFSLDNILIDLLRPVLENYLSIGFRFAAISSFVPTFLVPVLICLGLGVYIGRLYLFGSTAAKRIYAASISPLLSDVSEAVSGIEVIRSFKQEAAFEDNFLSKLANYIRAWEAVSDCQRWLAVRMDILAGLISFSAAILAYMSTKDSPAVVGFSLTSSTILCTSLLYVVYLSSLLEVELTSFHRIQEYTTTVPQESDVSKETDPTARILKWPANGHIKVKDLSIGYSLDGKVVIDGFNLEAKPNKRIAIVGRTGAGKSTIASSLLRLTTKFSGKIDIDDVDIDDVPNDKLRRGITYIPQNPTLFEGTIRFNIDFNGAVPDATLQTLLNEVKGTSSWALDDRVDSDGSNFSQGERQLLALCRALANESKIIIIDEATASLDVESEQRIQHLIRTKFSNATVIAIAHRLDTIIDFDEVLVLESGRVLERGRPKDLVGSKHGLFYSLFQGAKAKE